MFHFGFSYIGLIWLLMLLVPNFAWMMHKPQEYSCYAQKEKFSLVLMEKMGQMLICVCVLIFSDFNIRKTGWAVWLILSFAMMVLYVLYWGRCLKGGCSVQDLYRPFLKIRTPGAILPVLAFVFLAVYGDNAFLMFFAVLFGIGRIGIHRQREKELLGARKTKTAGKILKGIGAGLAGLLTVIALAVLTGRNIHYMKHFELIRSGIDESGYVTLGGQQQYVLIRGKDMDNPVIIYLHGGPASPDTGNSSSFTDSLVEDYMVIAWDQRGCGRTYDKNREADPENGTVSFEQLQNDLDELVDYARKRFGREKVILMGHSWGTIVGSVYAQTHPEKLEAYIGVGQVVSLESSEYLSYRDALAKAQAKGDDTSEMEEAFRKLDEGRTEEHSEAAQLENLMALRTLVSRYHPAEPLLNSIRLGWGYVTAPYWGWEDLRWTLRILEGMDEYVKLNRQLYAYTFAFDLNKRPLCYEIPVYWISGADDWTCPTNPIRDYVDSIRAPEKSFTVFEGTGHCPQYTMPEKFGETVRELLSGQ